MTTAVFRIASENEGKFEKKLAKLNRVATKLGVAPITYKLLGRDTIAEQDADGPTGYFIHIAKYEVTGEAPVISGWQFAATVQHSHGKPIFRKASDFVVPEKYLEINPSLCEHCNKIRYRNDTFLVKNVETGELKVVGSGCLKDFLGHASPAQIATWMEYVTNLESMSEDMEFAGPYERRQIKTVTFVAFVAYELRMNKFVSRNMIKMGQVEEGTMTTGDAALANMTNRKRKMSEEPTVVDSEIGMRALEWMRAIKAPPHKEFLYNLSIISQSDMLEFRDLGFIAAGVSSYLKATATPKEKPTDLNEYFGKVGEKIHTEVKIAHTQNVESAWGISRMFIFKHAKTGQTLVWFGSGQGAADMYNKWSTAPDRSKIIFVIKGSVKGHKERNGTKQTMLTRVVCTETNFEA